MFTVSWGRATPGRPMFYPRLPNGNNFAGSASLAEVCALLSAILVKYDLIFSNSSN